MSVPRLGDEAAHIAGHPHFGGVKGIGTGLGIGVGSTVGGYQINNALARHQAPPAIPLSGATGGMGADTGQKVDKVIRSRYNRKRNKK